MTPTSTVTSCSTRGPRVSGQVARVLVDDNQRVKKGDLLVQLDKEPFQVQVALKRAAVRVAEANLAMAESKARGLEAQLGSQRLRAPVFLEQVDAQVAQLKVKDATLRTQEAILDRAGKADYERGRALGGDGGPGPRGLRPAGAAAAGGRGPGETGAGRG